MKTLTSYKLEKYVRRIWQSGSSMGMGWVLHRVGFRAGVLASPCYSQSSLCAQRLCIQEMAALNPVSPSIGSTELGQKVKTGACPKSHPGAAACSAEVLRCQANAFLPSPSPSYAEFFIPFFLSFILPGEAWHHPRMMFTEGRGYSKSRQKEGRLQDYVCDKGIQKSGNFTDVIWSPCVNKSCLSRESAL